jgi:glutathione S-transferase
LEAALTDRTLGVEVPPDKQRMVGYGSFAAVMDNLERAVSAHPYIAGEQFSAADVYCGSHINWGLQFGSLEKRPAFAEYWARVGNRDAYKRATELDDALLPKKAP